MFWMLEVRGESRSHDDSSRLFVFTLVLNHMDTVIRKINRTL